MEQCKVDWEKRRWSAICSIMNGMVVNGKHITSHSIVDIVYQADQFINYLKNEGKEMEDDAQV